MKKTDEELREEALFNPMTYSLYSMSKIIILLYKVGIISLKQFEELKNNHIKPEEDKQIFENSVEKIIELLKSQEENKND